VNTTSLSRGIVRSTCFRLCSRAPRTTMARPSNELLDRRRREGFEGVSGARHDGLYKKRREIARKGLRRAFA